MSLPSVLPRPFMALFRPAVGRRKQELLMLGAALLFGFAGAARAQSVPGFTVTTFATGIDGARGVSTDSEGNVYTMGVSTGTVYKLDPTGGKTIVVDLMDIPGGYVGPYFDPVSENLFVCAHMQHQVFEIPSSGTYSSVGSVSFPSGVTSDANGDLYVTAKDAGGLGYLYKIPRGGSPVLYASGFHQPDGLVFGPGGDLFVGNRTTGEILRVPPGGGTPVGFASGVGWPLGVTIDHQGDLYVADFLSGNLWKVGASGAKSLIGTGFSNPTGLTFDPNGNLYVAELGVNRISKIAPANRVPDISAAAPSIASIWPPNNKMVDIAINGVTDPDGDPVTITIDSITNNETGTADAGGIGTSTAQVRAARNGKGNGRIYTISFTADDGHGGTASDSVQVVVPHDQGRRAKPAAVESATWGEIKNSQQ